MELTLSGGAPPRYKNGGCYWLGPSSRCGHAERAVDAPAQFLRKFAPMLQISHTSPTHFPTLAHIGWWAASLIPLDGADDAIYPRRSCEAWCKCPVRGTRRLLPLWILLFARARSSCVRYSRATDTYSNTKWPVQVDLKHTARVIITI